MGCAFYSCVCNAIRHLSQCSISFADSLNTYHTGIPFTQWPPNQNIFISYALEGSNSNFNARYLSVILVNGVCKPLLHFLRLRHGILFNFFLSLIFMVTQTGSSSFHKGSRRFSAFDSCCLSPRTSSNSF